MENLNYQGSTITGSIQTIGESPCPCCGYCRHCGRRNFVSPYYPYTYPYYYYGSFTATDPINFTATTENNPFNHRLY